MPGSPENFSDIARSIQLALAPAFLLTGMAALINVMAGRDQRGDQTLAHGPGGAGNEDSHISS